MGKKSELTASKLILESLTGCSRTKKDLKRVLKAKSPSLKSKHTKRALKDLVSDGRIRKDGKEYRFVADKSWVPSKPGSILSTTNEMEESTVPIGMKLRAAPKKKQVTFSKEIIDSASGDIDDEIARLERELMGSGDESEDFENSSDEDELDNVATSDGKKGILSLSEFANDRVKSLASACLPVPGKYSLTKKKKDKSNKSNTPVEKSGLQKAVEEVLGGYTARSSEKIPFYCRFCSKQYENEAAFFEHKASDFHKTAVALERKATYCKLCRKQFTSPIQMKEHLSSRPHKQRLQNARSQQQKRRFR